MEDFEDEKKEYKYVYEDPRSKGMTQFYLTRKQHNSLFEYRQMKWYHKYEYFYNDNIIIMHRYRNMLGIITQVMLFPVVVLAEGFGEFGEIIKEYKKLFNQKKYGSFTSDSVWKSPKTDNMFGNIMSYIRENERR